MALPMSPNDHFFSRRDFLWRTGGGLGGLALAHMLGAQTPRADINGGLHHKAKAKRVIQLFMNGGVSQVDTFDYKPELIKRHGEKRDFGIKAAATSTPGAVMKSPFNWKQHGQCGRWVSDVFPHVAQCVGDLAFLMAMASKTNVPGPARYMPNTGSGLPRFPCLAAGIPYAVAALQTNLSP